MSGGTWPWKRIELPASLHRELAAAAKVVNLSTQAYAAYLISRGLKQDAELAQIPFRERAQATSASSPEA